MSQQLATAEILTFYVLNNDILPDLVMASHRSNVLHRSGTTQSWLCHKSNIWCVYMDIFYFPYSAVYFVEFMLLLCDIDIYHSGFSCGNIMIEMSEEWAVVWGRLMYHINKKIKRFLFEDLYRYLLIRVFLDSFKSLNKVIKESYRSDSRVFSESFKSLVRVNQQFNRIH